MQGILICDNRDVAGIAPRSKQHGLGIEVQAFYEPCHAERDPQAIERHKRALAGITLRSMHAPFADLNAGSCDDAIRAVTRTRYQDGCRVGLELGVQHLVYHLGFVPNTTPPAEWVPRCIALWQAFLAELDRPLHFHLENLLEEDYTIVREVIAGVGDPRLDVCLDIGHAHAFSKRPVLEWIETLGSSIGYVHMHNNHGSRDEHLAFPSGTIPLLEVCRALESRAPNACWAIEVDGGAVQASLEWLAAHGFLKLS